MSRPCVLIMIDSATRDALSQLLVARYLARKGVRVRLCNQLTWVRQTERYRPQVLYASWFAGESAARYLRTLHRRTRILLVDQEGGRMGEEAFQRTMRDHNGIKLRVAKTATRVIAWGHNQAHWLRELDCIAPERIVVTGCPRLDPYLVEPRVSTARRKFFGVTLRTDRLTSEPRQIVKAIYESLSVSPQEGLTPGLPLWAQYEDWLWQAAAVVRHMLKIMVKVTQQTDAPVVLRPGPWEQAGAYQFLCRQLPQVSLEPMMLQHEYVRNAFATLDASSALGLEAILAGTPVISVNALVPRLDEHVGGPGGTRLNAPYRQFYWHPTTVEEAVNYILQAEQGELPISPSPDMLGSYFREYMDWPTPRPASFRIGDEILSLLDQPVASSAVTPNEADDQFLKRCFYRYVPGSIQLLKAKLMCQHVLSRDRQLWFRYHYSHALYPHHREVEDVFNALWNMYEIRSQPVTRLPEQAALPMKR